MEIIKSCPINQNEFPCEQCGLFSNINKQCSIVTFSETIEDLYESMYQLASVMKKN